MDAYIFFLVKATKQNLVTDETVAKLSTITKVVVSLGGGGGGGIRIWCLETRLAGIIGDAPNAPQKCSGGASGKVDTLVLRHFLPDFLPALFWQTTFDSLLRVCPAELIRESFCGS